MDSMPLKGYMVVYSGTHILLFKGRVSIYIRILGSILTDSMDDIGCRAFKAYKYLGARASMVNTIVESLPGYMTLESP